MAVIDSVDPKKLSETESLLKHRNITWNNNTFKEIYMEKAEGFNQALSNGFKSSISMATGTEVMVENMVRAKIASGKMENTDAAIEQEVDKIFTRVIENSYHIGETGNGNILIPKSINIAGKQKPTNPKIIIDEAEKTIGNKKAIAAMGFKMPDNYVLNNMALLDKNQMTEEQITMIQEIVEKNNANSNAGAVFRGDGTQSYSDLVDSWNEVLASDMYIANDSGRTGVTYLLRSELTDKPLVLQKRNIDTGEYEEAYFSFDELESVKASKKREKDRFLYRSYVLEENFEVKTRRFSKKDEEKINKIRAMFRAKPIKSKFGKNK